MKIDDGAALSQSVIFDTLLEKIYTRYWRKYNLFLAYAEQRDGKKEIVFFHW